jgi:hypothetical protein
VIFAHLTGGSFFDTNIDYRALKVAVLPPLVKAGQGFADTGMGGNEPMMQKIMFQDNIYQLTRSIELTHEGLLLDLSDDFFFDKTVDDVLFYDASIRKLTAIVESNGHIAGYDDILHCLYSCQNRFARLVDFILSGKTAMTQQFVTLFPKLREIKARQSEIQDSLARDIGKIDKSSAASDIVSSNELSELLNF